MLLSISQFLKESDHTNWRKSFLGFFYVLLVFLHTNSKNYFIWNICLFKTSSDRRFGWSLCRKPLEGDQFHAIWSLWSISSWTLSQIPTIDTENHFSDLFGIVEHLHQVSLLNDLGHHSWILCTNKIVGKNIKEY